MISITQVIGLVLLSPYGCAQQHFLTAQTNNTTDFRKLFGSTWNPDSYGGLVSLFSIPPSRCFGADIQNTFDIAILGAPFDTAVTYRPGARFGPNGIRQGGRRIGTGRFSYNFGLDVDPLDGKTKIVDCGDVPMTYFDNPVAIEQLEGAYKSIVKRKAATQHKGKSLSKSGVWHSRAIVLGGDHAITLPLLRGAAEIYGPVSLVHFDSHLDSWHPFDFSGHYPDAPPEKLPLTHGSQLWLAAKEGLLSNTSLHVGIRTRLESLDDYREDRELGFEIIHADEIEDIGYKGVAQKIKDRVGDSAVYSSSSVCSSSAAHFFLVSFDIDVIDPAFAPATGTPEIGGFTTREMKKILQALDGLRIVGVDMVEVAPPFDSQDELTSITAAQLLWEMLSLMVKTPV